MNSTNQHLIFPENNGDTKKLKMECEGTLSRVIHIRSLPPNVNEHEIALLAIPFGTISNMVLVKKNFQALIEMSSTDDAVSMVQYYDEFPYSLNGRTLAMQFSKYSKLDTHMESVNVIETIKQANKLVDDDLPDNASGNPISVLKILIDNVMNQQINHLILFKHLNGQNIYTGCCNLQIDFSKNRGPLEVRNESDKCRDYVRSPLTKDEEHILKKMPGDGKTAGMGIANSAMGHMGGGSSMGMNSMGPMGGGGSMLPMQGMGKPVMGDLTTQLTALAQQSGIMLTPQAAAAAASFMALTSVQQNQGGGSVPGLGSGMGQMSMMGGQNPNVGAQNNSSVLMVSNLDEDKITPDALFTLFGVYGDVTRVKIMFNKKNTALVQFVDPNQAGIAMHHLSGQLLWGKVMRIHRSKHGNVQMPKDDVDANLTKDYTNSKLHRFRKPNSKNFQNIYPPNETLHLSNIPEEMSEGNLIKLFESNGFTVENFQFMQKDRRMALLQLPNKDQAMQALVALHDAQLTDSAHLRLSFSKSGL